MLAQKLSYTCQLSRLWAENFDLTPAHACGPISHAWLKNVSCCCLAWHNFQKYVNSDPCNERKPCVKWINDNTFLAISDFWSEKHWERARLWQTSADFGRLRKTSDVFGRLQTSSGIFGNDRVVFKNPSTPRIKISCLYLRKSWQVYYPVVWTLLYCAVKCSVTYIHTYMFIVFWG